MADMLFEWDDEKESINIKKHGLSFSTASLVFSDPDYIEIYDELHSNDEDRYIVIGKVNDILFVVYTCRESAIRIISARVATKKETDIYYGNY